MRDNLRRVVDYAANPEKTEYGALSQALHYAGNDAKTTLTESAKLVSGHSLPPRNRLGGYAGGTAEVRQDRGRGGDCTPTRVSSLAR